MEQGHRQDLMPREIAHVCGICRMLTHLGKVDRIKIHTECYIRHARSGIPTSFPPESRSTSFNAPIHEHLLWNVRIQNIELGRSKGIDYISHVARVT